MNKTEAIKDAKLKRKWFPEIGKLFLLKDKRRGYFSVSEKYYNDNLHEDGEDFMKRYKIIEVV